MKRGNVNTKNNSDGGVTTFVIEPCGENKGIILNSMTRDKKNYVSMDISEIPSGYVYNV
jgi:hypothetical protein